METTTHAELASLIGNWDYDDKFTNNLIKLATNNGLVIVTAIGDDVIKFQGSVKDEADCRRGGDVFLGIEDGEILVFKKQNDAKSRIRIQGVWEKHRIYTWKFRILIPYANFPHSKFKVLRGGNSWCEGIVFSIKDIGA